MTAEALRLRLGAEAEWRELLDFVTGRDSLLFGEPSAEQLETLTALIDRRLAGEPLQYLTGRAFFRRIEVAVGPGVFIPRPETELLVEWALPKLHPGDRVVELCAGSGAISRSLAAESPGLEQYAVELDPAAFAWTTRNLAGRRVHLVLGDLAEALPELDGTVAAILVNPPYVPTRIAADLPSEVVDHEPQLALFAGAEGLDVLRVVARAAARLLKPGGFIVAEHDDSHELLAPRLFSEAGFVEVQDHRDLAGRPRFVTASRAE